MSNSRKRFEAWLFSHEALLSNPKDISIRNDTGIISTWTEAMWQAADMSIQAELDALKATNAGWVEEVSKCREYALAIERELCAVVRSDSVCLDGNERLGHLLVSISSMVPDLAALKQRIAALEASSKVQCETIAKYHEAMGVGGGSAGHPSVKIIEEKDALIAMQAEALRNVQGHLIYLYERKGLKYEFSSQLRDALAATAETVMVELTREVATFYSAKTKCGGGGGSMPSIQVSADLEVGHACRKALKEIGE